MSPTAELASAREGRRPVWLRRSEQENVLGAEGEQRGWNRLCRTKRPWQSHGKEFRLYWKVFKSMNQGGKMIRFIFLKDFSGCNVKLKYYGNKSAHAKYIGGFV